MPDRQLPEPLIKREKLIIEKIGLAGLLFLWLNAVAVSFSVPLICGIALFQSFWIGIVAGVVVSALVAARAAYRIRGSLRQSNERRRPAKRQ